MKRLLAGGFLMLYTQVAGVESIITDDSQLHFEPGDLIFLGSTGTPGGKEQIRIKPDGRVILAPGTTLDEASYTFWRAIEQSAPSMCDRIIKERQGGK